MQLLKYLIPSLGGFQFGYAIGIMAGAILFIGGQFSLTPEQQGTLVSSFLMGAVPGAGVAGWLANRFGRKKTQQLAALLFLVGAGLLIFANSIPTIMAGRIIQGLASGIVAVVTPMYIAEISPPERRGVHVSYYQLAVTFGIFVAYLVNLLFSGNWHAMLGVGLLPALFHFLGFFKMPESLVAHPEQQKPTWRVLMEPGVRSGLLLAVLLNVFQQISGINAVLYFAPSICLSCGFNSTSMALWPPIFIGLINFGMTILAIKYIDKLGRKPLLLWGLGGMVVALIALATAFHLQGPALPWIATLSLLLYIASFAIGMGPIPQLVGTEIFPRRARGQGISIANLSNWLFNFIVVFTFMDLTTRFSTAGAFAIYGFFALLAFYFVWRHLPETKGKVLD